MPVVVDVMVDGGGLTLQSANGARVQLPLVRGQGEVEVQVHVGNPDDILMGGWEPLSTQPCALGGDVDLATGRPGAQAYRAATLPEQAADHLVHVSVLPATAPAGVDHYLVVLQPAADADGDDDDLEEAPGRLPRWPSGFDGAEAMLDVDYGCVALIRVPDAGVLFTGLDEAEWDDDGWALGEGIVRVEPVSQYGMAEIRVAVGAPPASLPAGWRTMGQRRCQLGPDVFVATLGDGPHRDPQQVATLPPGGYVVHEYGAQGFVPEEPDRYLLYLERA